MCFLGMGVVMVQVISSFVSFFFSRLGAFLESSSGHCLRVRLFASRDSALRLVLIELYLGLSK